MLHTEINLPDYFVKYEGQEVGLVPVWKNEGYYIGVVSSKRLGYLETSIEIDCPTYKACVAYCERLCLQLFNMKVDRLRSLFMLSMRDPSLMSKDEKEGVNCDCFYPDDQDEDY